MSGERNYRRKVLPKCRHVWYDDTKGERNETTNKEAKFMRKDILDLLERNAKLTPEEIAVRLGLSEPVVREEIEKMEKEQIICGYGAFINRERTDMESLTALIEVKVTPVRGKGFNSIAERIYRFDEVKAVYLMSGGYDLAVIIEGKSLKDVSLFVSDKLSPLESVLSTATHFVLKKYKDHGVIFSEQDGGDERMIVSP
jgi:DNA-binding Lrp family transcriptional regulator